MAHGGQESGCLGFSLAKVEAALVGCGSRGVEFGGFGRLRDEMGDVVSLEEAIVTGIAAAVGGSSGTGW